MNRSLQVLLSSRQQGQTSFDHIVVGVIYGTQESLTDKYRIIRGLTTRAEHDIADISAHVQVLAGREFWSWLNDDEARTQEWILEGIALGYELAVEEHGPIKDLFENFVDDYASTFDAFISEEGDLDWEALLRDING